MHSSCRHGPEPPAAGQSRKEVTTKGCIVDGVGGQQQHTREDHAGDARLDHIDQPLPWGAERNEQPEVMDGTRRAEVSDSAAPTLGDRLGAWLSSRARGDAPQARQHEPRQKRTAAETISRGPRPARRGWTIKAGNCRQQLPVMDEDGWMARPAACLFDLDGVLLDTEPLHSQAWQRAADQFGLELTPSQVLALRGRRRLDCAEQVHHWIAAAGLAAPSVEALLAVRQPIANVLLPGAAPMPGAAALIKSCRQRAIPMALVTSSSRAAVALKATPHPWLATISLRVYGDDPELAAGKPAPDPYLLAARRLQVDVRRCWAFEDSQAGASSASGAGCKVHVLLPADPQQAAAVAAAVPSSCQLLHALDQVLIPW